MAKVKLEDLLAKKMDRVVKATYESKELGGEIDIVKDSIIAVMEIMDRVEEGGGLVENYVANCKLIFKHCPIFKNKELQEEYKVGEPWEIVPLLLNESMKEIGEIAEAVLNLYDFQGEDIKN